MGDPNYSIVENRASAIDPEGVGPFPPNTDDRQRDVFQDQEDRINGRRAEAEPITEDFDPPTAFDVGPPPMPDLQFASTQSAEEAAAEAARAAINDALRNMTINGVSPNISGGGISFDIPVEPSASSAFAAMNAIPDMEPPLPDTPAIVPMPQPTVEVNLPELPETTPLPAPPDTGPTPTSEPAETPQDTVEVDVPPATEAEIPEQPTGDSPQEGGGPPEADEAPEAASNAPEAEEDAQKSDPTGIASSERQRGEMRGEYEERQKEIKQVMEDETAAKAFSVGDTSYINGGYVPVLLTRKDGRRKILAQIDNAFAAVVEGAIGREKTTTLPPDNGYYVSGGEGSVPPHPWQILLENRSTGNTPNFQYKIEPASRLYRGLDSWSNIDVTGIGEWRPASAGYITLFGVVDNGSCTGASIQNQSQLSDRIDFVGENQNSFTVQLGFIFSEENSLVVRQNAFHNFTIIDTCVGGKLAIYPLAT
jgi:hypothetical protein